MMKPSAILRSLSLRIPGRLSASPVVAPLPITSPFDQQVTAELDALQSQRASNFEYTSAIWLLDALNASITTQKITLKSLASSIYQDSDRKVIDQYLEDNIKMLDTCNELSEKIESIQKYIESLRVVSHLLQGNYEPSPTVLARARDVLDSCEDMERRCGEMNKCGSGVRKLLAHGEASLQESQLGEILSGSKAVALVVCGILGLALSFKSKRGLPTILQSQPITSWLCCLQELQKRVKDPKSGTSMMLNELRRTVMAARDLRDQLKCNKQSELTLIVVEELKRSCGELEEGMESLEGAVKELYKHLISVRMALLGILSQA